MVDAFHPLGDYPKTPRKLAEDAGFDDFSLPVVNCGIGGATERVFFKMPFALTAQYPGYSLRGANLASF